MIKYINIALFAGMIVMNWLANALPLNNVTTGELSDSYPNLFVPAGITFSIWGIIYLLLGIFCGVQFMQSNSRIVSSIGWVFAVTCLLNGLWIVAWHFRLVPLSLLIMVLLLLSLIYINTTIRDTPFGLIKAAFGVYLGWICIATIANVTALLVNYSWGGFGIGQQAWTIIMIATGTIIVFLTIFRLMNPFIGLSVIWAFAGIAIKRQDDYKVIFMSAIVAMVIITVATLAAFMRKKLLP
ncbi:MAG: tryptophan-rich sensory protein [Bacteroidales bacterium]